MMDSKKFSGTSYFVIIIDDHTRKVWIFPLKYKNHILCVFKHFHTSFEIENGLKSKFVRANNSVEYKCPFEEYYKDIWNDEIGLHKTIRKKSQHNSVAERIKHMINDIIMCILKDGY